MDPTSVEAPVAAMAATKFGCDSHGGSMGFFNNGWTNRASVCGIMRQLVQLRSQEQWGLTQKAIRAVLRGIAVGNAGDKYDLRRIFVAAVFVFICCDGEPVGDGTIWEQYGTICEQYGPNTRFFDKLHVTSQRRMIRYLTVTLKEDLAELQRLLLYRHYMATASRCILVKGNQFFRCVLTWLTEGRAPQMSRGGKAGPGVKLRDAIYWRECNVQPRTRQVEAVDDATEPEGDEPEVAEPENDRIDYALLLSTPLLDTGAATEDSEANSDVGFAHMPLLMDNAVPTVDISSYRVRHFSDLDEDCAEQPAKRRKLSDQSETSQNINADLDDDGRLDFDFLAAMMDSEQGQPDLNSMTARASLDDLYSNGQATSYLQDGVINIKSPSRLRSFSEDTLCGTNWI